MAKFIGFGFSKVLINFKIFYERTGNHNISTVSYN
jgi:hypothetical protein